MYKKLFIFVSLAALTSGANCLDTNDFYFHVGPCNDNMLQKAVTTFDIKEIANTGYYVYLYSTGFQGVDCASAEIHGDDDIMYRRTITQQIDGKNVTALYSLDKIRNGVIDETLLVKANGSSTKYKYKIVVLGWDKDNGILYYGRCSEKGTALTDSRSIIVRKCNYSHYWAITGLFTYLNLDKSYKFNGDLRRLPEC